MKIIVAYWHSVIPAAGYKDRQEFPYSTRKQNAIVNDLLKKGLSVMLRPMTLATKWDIEGVIIYIDNGRFGQR